MDWERMRKCVRALITVTIVAIFLCPVYTSCGEWKDPPCEAVCWMKNCKYGFATRGCPRCSCAPNPCPGNCTAIGEKCTSRPSKCGFVKHCHHEAICGNVCIDRCTLQCPFGYSSRCPCVCAPNPCATKNCGVWNCKTRPSKCSFNDSRCDHEAYCVNPVCERSCTNVTCNHGFKSQGCPRCTCAPNPCNPNPCGPEFNYNCTTLPGKCEFKTNCPHVHKCVKPTVCAPTCPQLTCPYGFMEKGCPRCTCSPNPCRTDTCPKHYKCVTKPGKCALAINCPHVHECIAPACKSMCQVNCTYGFKNLNCFDCTCQPNPCLTKTCPVNFKCVAVPGSCSLPKGCPYTTKCEPTLCARTCPQLTCPYGFMEKGCPRCTCSPNPCLPNPCPSLYKCTSKPGGCSLGNKCPHVHECTAPACKSMCNQVNCPFGFNSLNCFDCTCQPNPCSKKTCPVNSKCVAVPDTCSLPRGCPYKATCEPTLCARTCPQLICPYGFMEKGCPRCTCSPNPCSPNPCPALYKCTSKPGTCSLGVRCPHVHECTAPECKAVCRNINCPFGFKSLNCNDCTCLPNPCSPDPCGVNTRCEVVKGPKCPLKSGCPMAKICKPTLCAETCSQLICPYGFMEKGCPRCTCSPNPCGPRTCPTHYKCTTKPGRCSLGVKCPHVHECTAPDCKAVCRQVNCPYGFKTLNCFDCTCQPNPCSPNPCGVNERCEVVSGPKCPLKTGCPMNYTCKPTVCAETCSQLICPYGFMEMGCPRCTCSPNPCGPRTCPTHYKCTTKPGRCSLGVKCPHVHECTAPDCKAVCRQVNCPYGFKTLNCFDCTCQPNPCSPNPCGVNERCEVVSGPKCPLKTGCPMNYTCKPTVCAETCSQLICPYGFMEMGCPRCTCSPNPCRPNTCPTHYKCTTKPGRCSLGVKCPHVHECTAPDCTAVCRQVNCPYGFKTLNCFDCTCQPNPCSPNPCGVNERCEVVSGPKCPLKTGCPMNYTCKPTVCAETCSQLICPYGFMEMGCPRCTCSPNPCRPRTCPTHYKCTTKPGRCSLGVKCPHVHECTAPDCKAVCRQVNCPYGFKTLNCFDCTCQPNPCSPNPCGVNERCEVVSGPKCPLKTGCPMNYTCKPTVCAETCSQLICPYGFMEMGCPRCTCSPNPCRPKTCPTHYKCTTKPGTCSLGVKCPHVHECTAPDCKAVCRQVNCPYGFKTLNCFDCTCQPNPCSPNPCGVNERCEVVSGPKCPLKTGCPMNYTCKPTVCAETCSQLICPYGFMEMGCPRCTCSPNPCRPRTCPTHYKCTTKPGRCSLGVKCPHVHECTAPDCKAVCRQVNCPYGFKTLNCFDCTCQPNPCSPNPCGVNERCEVVSGPKCPLKTGCPMNYTCKPTVCAETCSQLICPYGFMEKGCPRCTCSPNPCGPRTCPTHYKCTTKPGRCSLGVKCPHVHECTAPDCKAVCRQVNCPYGFKTLNCFDCTCQPNPCSPNPCGVNERCEVVSGPKCPLKTGCPMNYTCKPTVCAETCSQLICPYGFMEKGCPRCTCSPNPCRPKTCPTHYKCTTKPGRCSLGVKCPHVHECTAPDCKAVCRQVNCPYGFKTLNCFDCTCQPNPCSPNPCGVNERCEVVSGPKCPLKTGCPMNYTCKPTVCAETCSQLICPYGFMERGCPRCTCSPNPCRPKTCPTHYKCTTKPGRCSLGVKCPHVHECTAPDCKAVCRQVNCPYGFKTLNCFDCTCQPNPCSPNPCGVNERCEVVSGPKCPLKTGCPMNYTCKPTVCAETCSQLICPYGFMERGCPRCTCSPNPCRPKTCPTHYKCTTKPGRCSLGVKCPHVHECTAPDCKAVCRQVNCPYGFKTLNCFDCTCQPNPCSPNPCGVNERCEVVSGPKCPLKTGCPMNYTCKPTVCAETCSQLICPYGFMEKGCPRCTCSPNPCRPNTCPTHYKCTTKPGRCSLGVKCPHVHECTAPDCKAVCRHVHCPYGFKSLNCYDCTCLPNPCSPNLCGVNTRCEVVKGPNCPLKTGCPLTYTCKPTVCAETCSKVICPYGFMERGCPRCTCSPNPCRPNSCPAHHTCTTKPENCSFGVKCPHRHHCIAPECKTVCRNVNCPFGFKTLDCYDCTCQPNPCTPNRCGVNTKCEVVNGPKCPLKTGCPMTYTCTPTLCAKTCAQVICPYGFLEKGCPRCTCSPNPCHVHKCSSHEVCRTKASDCALKISCPHIHECVIPDCRGYCKHVTCPFGFKSPHCHDCTCQVDPCLTKACDADHKCVAVPDSCSYRRGCPYRAECRPTVCAPVCQRNCPYGFLIKDCPRCSCAPNPCSICAKHLACTTSPTNCRFNYKCPHNATCYACTTVCHHKRCPYGVLEDGSCPRCACAPNPCQYKICGVAEKCVTEPGPCVSRVHCPHKAVCKPTVCKGACQHVSCPFGFKTLDCNDCTCQPNPCYPNPCQSNQKCVAVKTPNCNWATGCPMVSECKPTVCAAVCQRDCPYGFLLKDCPRCSCAPNPCSICAKHLACTTSPTNCRFNYKCPHNATCYACAEVCHHKRCQYGVLEDGSCPRCICAVNPCQHKNCGVAEKCVTEPDRCVSGVHCPHKAVCKPTVCEAVCKKNCPYGFLSQDCPRCTCAPNPCHNKVCRLPYHKCVAVPGTCPFTKGCPYAAKCHPTVCKGGCQHVSCPFGFKTLDCHDCTCQPNPCYPNLCAHNKKCIPVKIANCSWAKGCPMVAHCKDTVCEATCNKNCPYGFLHKDCPRCTCAANPCSVSDCPHEHVCDARTHKCFIVPGTCPFTQGCPFKHECRPIVCENKCDYLSCPFGYKSHGCPRCTCQQNPCYPNPCSGGRTCRAVKSVTCPWVAGCPMVAECRPPACEQRCERVCRYGFKQNTCPRCDCRSNPCHTKACPSNMLCYTERVECAFLRGCPYRAVCKYPACDRTCTTISCPYGFMVEGCPRCKCAPNPCRNETCGQHQVCDTKPTICGFTKCPHTAICKSRVCEECCTTKNCKHGFLSKGCPRCTCAPDPCGAGVNPCSHSEICVSEATKCQFKHGCPHRAVCKPRVCERTCQLSKCRYGFMNYGCPRCRCAPDPCHTKVCNAGTTCVAVSSKCQFRSGCPYTAVCRRTPVTTKRCHLPPQRGSCQGSHPRVYYDRASRMCRWFTYTGCGGNANNFLNWWDCYQTCATSDGKEKDSSSQDDGGDGSDGGDNGKGSSDDDDSDGDKNGGGDDSSDDDRRGEGTVAPRGDSSDDGTKDGHTSRSNNGSNNNHKDDSSSDSSSEGNANKGKTSNAASSVGKNKPVKTRTYAGQDDSSD